ncbi:DUF4179 domain-containing protein [Paenibacillus lentus]|uniref:DUF4179 domain-containing protein n=1 Tax=Paenibacillus lentus TaxID=1338368 RepID=A0A3Q8S6N7_9BACL|nr:DUF4179 domain-containing protein [Paenibacillus lentus]AZK48474.1 DUF4179 domain-containing protein [Paenibacillus lentus]
MNRIEERLEERLKEEKMRLDSVTAPKELETRLRDALNKTDSQRAKRRVPPLWKAAAVALLFLVVFGYHYDAFAYYGKKLLGFDELIGGSQLQELNEQGLGQLIGKTTKLENGTVVTIDGIMADANQLIMYYTLTNSKGLENDGGEIFRASRITGFLTNSYVQSGTSIINEEHTEIKAMRTFEPVNPFAKQLTLHYREQLPGNQEKEGSISFPYDLNKAMNTEVKQSIRKTFKVDKGEITFGSITATPTLTSIKGSLHVENFDRVSSALNDIELIANGIPVNQVGSGYGTSIKGTRFELQYEPLPKELNSLELVMKKFVGYQQLDQRLPLSSAGNEPFFFSLDSKELWVKKVAVTSQGVEITIATDNDVMLDGVSIEAQNEITSLRTTVNQLDGKLEDGTILKERTLLFDTSVMPEYLHIKGMHYMKEYNQVIKIPVD